MQLRNLQQAFVDDIFNVGANAIQDQLDISPEILDDRFNTYIHNIFNSLYNCLSSNFSRTKLVIGGRLFKILMKQFIHEHPPQSGCLKDYGAELSGYLKKQEPIHGIDFLADLVDVEWAINRVLFEAEKKKPQLENGTLDPDALSEVSVEFSPCVTLKKCPYNLDIVFNLEGGHIAERETFLMLYEHEHQPVVEKISPDTYTFFHGLIEGKNVLQAYEDATSINKRFNIQRALQTCITNDFIIKINMP